MPEFVPGLKEVVEKSGANLLNVTIRVVHADAVGPLPSAKQDMFAYGLYFNQELNDRQSKILEETTVDLIDLTVGLRGTFYSPDQPIQQPVLRKIRRYVSLELLTLHHLQPRAYH
jgi:hypothetical protein